MPLATERSPNFSISFFLSLRHMIDHIDDRGEQVHIQQQHKRQRQHRREERDHHREDEDAERHRDEELAEVEAGVHIVADVHAPRQALGLGHMVDVTGAHGLVLGVLLLALARLGGLGAGLAVLGHQRAQVLLLGVLALRAGMPLAGGGLGLGGLGGFLDGHLCLVLLLKRVPCHACRLR